MIEDLKQFLIENQEKSQFIKLSLNKEIRKQIEDVTTFLDFLKPRLKHRAYCIINDINENNIPLCACGCGEITGLDMEYHDKGFKEYKNAQHLRSRDRLPEGVKEKLASKEWLYERGLLLRKIIPS